MGTDEGGPARTDKGPNTDCDRDRDLDCGEEPVAGAEVGIVVAPSRAGKRPIAIPMAIATATPAAKEIDDGFSDLQLAESANTFMCHLICE